MSHSKVKDLNERKKDDENEQEDPDENRKLHHPKSVVAHLDDSGKDKPIYIVGNALECDSPVLASQIKNFAPSVNLTPISPSSIALPIARASSTALPRGKSSLHDAVSKKNVQFEPISSKVLIDDKIGEEPILDDKIIRDFPVSIQEKRRRRSTMFVHEGKVPWIKKLQRFGSRVYSRISQYELWNEHLKTIEGRFGAGVVSYFVFIRWLLYVNLIILLLNFIFLVFPQVAFEHQPHVHTNFSHVNKSRFPEFKTVYEYLKKERSSLEDLDDEVIEKSDPSNTTKAKSNGTKFSVEDIIEYCHIVYDKQIERVKYRNFFAKIQNFLQGTGYLEPTLLFIGHYAPEDLSLLGLNYKVPLAFIWVLVIFFIICLIMMVQYSSTGIQEAFLTHHDIGSLTNEVLGGWDYCVKTRKAALLQYDSFVIEIKSSLSDIRSRKEVEERSTSTWAKLYSVRIFINLVVILWIVACYVVIYHSAMYQLKELKTKQLRAAGFYTLLIQYLPSFAVIVVTTCSPILFTFLASFEGFYGQTHVNISIISVGKPMLDNKCIS